MSVFGDRLRDTRLSAGYTQEQLAHLIGTSQKQLSKYENGEQSPTIGVLESLSNVLNASADYLMGLTEIREKPLRGEGDLSKDEKDLITLIRQVSPSKRRQILTVVNALKEVEA